MFPAKTRRSGVKIVFDRSNTVKSRIVQQPISFCNFAYAQKNKLIHIIKIFYQSPSRSAWWSHDQQLTFNYLSHMTQEHNWRGLGGRNPCPLLRVILCVPCKWRLFALSSPSHVDQLHSTLSKLPHGALILRFDPCPSKFLVRAAERGQGGAICPGPLSY